MRPSTASKGRSEALITLTSDMSTHSAGRAEAEGRTRLFRSEGRLHHPGIEVLTGISGGQTFFMLPESMTYLGSATWAGVPASIWLSLLLFAAGRAEGPAR